MSATSRQPRVFISRTTAGLKALAERVAEVLRQRGSEPIIRTGFYPYLHDGKGLLAGHFQRQFTNSYGKTWVAKRWIPFFATHLFAIKTSARPPSLPSHRSRLSGSRPSSPSSFRTAAPTPPVEVRMKRSECRIFGPFIIHTFPGTLFKGREEFLAELRQHLTAEGPVVIKGKRTIHGMGGVGKTRAAIEYAWKHADDYRALLFSSPTPRCAYHCDSGGKLFFIN